MTDDQIYLRYKAAQKLLNKAGSPNPPVYRPRK